MLELAKNEKAGLFKVGQEYWVVNAKFLPMCYEKRSEHYTSANALADFQDIYGPATYVREGVTAGKY